MAPSRRRGVSKASAAAAARRKWKVGDLVLAKVKGFPAWPATVSEPEKWGYNSDWKKVLVYFFGTQQIAFCNPADVEPFTEEKKQSLLSKRHGKGADFVRAVREIVDIFDKLQKEAQLDEARCVVEFANANVSNPLDSSAKDQIDSSTRHQTDAPELAINLSMKSSNSITNRDELACATENDLALALEDGSRDNEASLEDPTDNTVAGKSSKTVTYSSRKRSGNLCRQGNGAQSHTPVRKCKSFSQVQNSTMHGIDGGMNADDLSANANLSKSARRSKCSRKSPDLSSCDDFGSSGRVSNGSMDDNGSEILTIDSETFSLNEGSTIESNFKHEKSETIECPEFELSKRLVETKGVVNKKKRKPNKKRETNNASKPISSRVEENAGSVLNSSQISKSVCRNSEEKCIEQVGDEHLPLLKRARVRMSNLSSTEVEFSNIVQAQEKICREDINSQQQMITSSNWENSPADGDSSVLNGAMDNISPSKVLVTCSDTQICNPKKEQSLCSVDGEAALPPSKRLHRALEAMSANAAEGGQTHMEASSSIVTSSVACLSSVERFLCMASNNQENNDAGVKGLDTGSIGSPQTDVHGISTSSNPLISTENKASLQVDNMLTKFRQHETGTDDNTHASDQVVDDANNYVVCHTAETESKSETSPILDSKYREVGSNCDLSDISLPSNEDKSQTLSHSNTASDGSEHNGMGFDPVACTNEKSIPFPEDHNEVLQNEVAVCDDKECLKPAFVHCNKSNDVSEAANEINCKGPEEDVNSVSTSDGYLIEKGIVDIRLSPSLTDGGDCIPPGSPPNTSVCNVSTSDSSNILHNGSCSPDVHLHQKQTISSHIGVGKDGFVATQESSSMGKSTEAGRAALLYFEATLGTLTRTKDSIGRATRIAIDCAKFGIAAKVMEILAHNLEIESSLHRRVDLFFLVDSIAQFSRGLKGDVCGVYPSAIQAVLTRLLSAAAPPGNSAQENRRQCLKVLKVWLERRILPVSVIRHHIRELDSYSSSAPAGLFSRRSLRTERALDDPIRDMEGMHVDEYGSNSSFQLPGLCMPRMLKDEEEDEGSDSDGGNFEAVTPEHDSGVQEMTSTVEKHRHILEDVDGELEMEDVAPSCDVEMNSFCNATEGNNTQFENPPTSFAPPQDVPPSPPPPPSSTPPPPPPPLPPPPPPPPMLHPVSSTSDPYGTVVNSKVYTDSQMQKDNTPHSMAQPICDAMQYPVPDYREIPMSDSNCSFNSYPAPPPDNFRHSDNMHNNGYSMRPPHHVPSNQFPFVHGEQHVKYHHHRDFLPPSSYSNRQHYMQNMERDNFYNNHERINPPPYDYRERWDVPPPYSGPYHDEGAPPPYGCHPCESNRIPGHRSRFPPRSMNHRNSMAYKPPFEDSIPVTNRGPGFWRPR
ncbi:hypothetical protein PIB30_012446 [Stylosanthes scabra]|uniref:Uncharacterized protein n=1 Tax=Stylosanthes scabra TaxID=79078 RepID=A0ABU6S6K0_9FABA|nr:hypothetical protein [Stylosanthes scabra]